MIYRFEDFELDTRTVELRKAGEAVAVEPQVFALIAFLVSNRERMVPKDEIVREIWDGRFVSDSAVASRVKSARQALGDSGKAQRLIKTVHGQGFRFVGPVARDAAVAVSPSESEAEEPALDVGPLVSSSKPSIAVLPFRLLGMTGPFSGIADALPHELIAELSRLRWLFVIARGSSFRFRGDDVDVCEAGARLKVRYCLIGFVEIIGNGMTATVELIDTRSGGVVWGERYASDVGGIHEIRTRIVSEIVSALEIQIPMNEAQIARLASPDHLDAWSAYHLGLQHMFRFNRADNDIATGMFERALEKEPGFARAHAGLSFTHFQNAFLTYTREISAETSETRRYAERAIELDPLDPFANFTMGRAHWLEGDLDGSLTWLDRATQLSPNYAHGMYARGWASAMTGRAEQGQSSVDLAMSLSPMDPLYYAMLATRGITHLVLGEDAEAAYWAEEGSKAPGAHVLIFLIAVAAHELCGNPALAEKWAVEARARNPSITQRDFLRSFPFTDGKTYERVSRALGAHGF